MDVSVAAGDLRLTARLTEDSCRELDLRPGNTVFASFKASSVRLY